MLVRHSNFVPCFLAGVFALGLGDLARAQGEPKAPRPSPPPAAEGRVDAPRGRGARLPDRRPSIYPRVFDARPQFYQDDQGYRFGVPAFEEIRDERVERAYQHGLADGRDSERYEIQAQRGLNAYRGAMLNGHRAFDVGKYGLAARQFLLAATLNQGDPVSRLCAAHAQMALKDYGPAARLLHRAFELQPKLVFLPMDIRGAYGVEGDFAKHRGALQKAASREKVDVDLWFLLGYVHYYTDNMAGAARTLKKATDLDPGDPLIAELASLAGMSAPSARSPKRGQ